MADKELKDLIKYLSSYIEFSKVVTRVGIPLNRKQLAIIIELLSEELGARMEDKEWLYYKT